MVYLKTKSPRRPETMNPFLSVYSMQPHFYWGIHIEISDGFVWHVIPWIESILLKHAFQQLSPSIESLEGRSKPYSLLIKLGHSFNYWTLSVF